MNKPEESFLRRNLGPLLTTIVPLVAVIVSASQIWIAHIAKEKETAINRERFDHQIKQDLVKFVTENKQDLFSEKESERAKVRDIISVAFPPEITEQLFKKLEATTTDENSKDTWRQGQEGIERIRLLQLISDLFSVQASVRKVAAPELIQGWKSDTLLVKHLLEFADSRLSNSNGIYNSVVVLNAVDRRPLLQYKDSILQFLDKAKERGPKTKSLAVQVRDRLDRL